MSLARRVLRPWATVFLALGWVLVVICGPTATAHAEDTAPGSTVEPAVPAPPSAEDVETPSQDQPSDEPIGSTDEPDAPEPPSLFDTDSCGQYGPAVDWTGTDGEPAAEVCSVALDPSQWRVILVALTLGLLLLAFHVVASWRHGRDA